MLFNRKLTLLGLLLGAGIGWHGFGLAQDDDSLPGEWAPVSAQRLDDLRGGFDTGTGLLVSFGIERAVSVNDNPIISTSFNIPNVANLTPEQAKLATAALSTVNLVQIGPGNSYQPGNLGPLNLGLTIQNTLSDQNIRTQTVINTSVNSLAMLKLANLQGVLNDALVNAVSVK